MKIIADDRIPFLKGVFEPYCEIAYIPGKDISPEHLVNADALIVRTRTLCNEHLLGKSKVKIVATATIGTDHFDIPWLEKAGIAWVNAPGCNSGSVQQYIGSVLAHFILEGMVPANSVIGIVGVGMVGSKVQRLASSLGFKVLLNDPPRQRKEKSVEFCDYNTILKESDIITFHTPLSYEGPDATFKLFNKESLRHLKSGVHIINSSRGEVVSNDSLFEGLSSGKISKLILDVWENEPDIDAELHNKVRFGTPHIAGYSMDGKANGTTMVVQKVSEVLGLPLTEWQPSSIPEPDEPFISIDSSNSPAFEAAAKAILATYDIKDDDKRLRANPELFEKLRGEYPLRREFQIWKIKKSAIPSENIYQMLKDIGFSFY